MSKRPLSDEALAAVNMLRRTGAESVQIRYSDDESPTVWIAVGDYNPSGFILGIGLDPSTAVLDLAERTIDGGMCMHCGRPTIFLAEFGPAAREGLPPGCFYQYDPELRTFRRSCEGIAP